jgi:hypothetical protein
MTLNTLLGLPMATKRLALIEKLACFDPAVHGAEIMVDTPLGNEFHAALAEVPHGEVSAADRL